MCEKWLSIQDLPSKQTEKAYVVVLEEDNSTNEKLHVIETPLVACHLKVFVVARAVWGWFW